MNILFLQTGGTIDKDYEKGRKAYLFEITDPAVERVLKRTHPNFDFRVVSITKKDSLDLTDDDRELIFQACEKSPEKNIVITHGTDTMTVTAELLTKVKDKTIVITGASRPERFTDSDAPFNLGCAISAVQTLQSGVYIAMSGRIYDWDKCEKAEDGQFVEKQ
ncbi:MAG: asparaginase [Candidatus Pacebacteria bacterium]|nr:asparaginase [Candidatus Paceibacterota bacterium]